MIYFAKWKMVLVGLMCVLGVAFAAPNFMSEEAAQNIPSWLPHKQINLGLDLRGGAHLLAEVEVNEPIKNQLEALESAIRGILRKNDVKYAELGSHLNGYSVQFVVREATPDKVVEVRRLMTAANLNDSGITAENNGNRIIVSYTPQSITERKSDAVTKSIEIIRRRIDEAGTREPTIQRQGEDRILIQVPGVKDTGELKVLIGKTAKMTFHMVNETVSAAALNGGRPPPGYIVLPHQERADGDLVIKSRPDVDGDLLVDAQPGYDQSNRPVVNFRFNPIGARKFANITQKNVGNRFAIVLDNEIISAPVIREPILGGSGQISGNFTTQSANQLALLLRAGALPAPIRYLEERSVGPGLGADSIAAGEFASVLAVILVVAFMAMAYGLFGVMADIALVANMILIVAALSLLQATLTLPGIAGIVLTIGMAVDANVLIFERIREEQRAGRTPISAVDAGYSRALTTIIDANVTTFFAGLLLFIFGSGPVRGFAVTLMIGLATSMFTAIMVTRLMVVTWLRRKRPKMIPI